MAKQSNKPAKFTASGNVPPAHDTVKVTKGYFNEQNGINKTIKSPPIKRNGNN
ncbi:hypothetical protein ACQCVB_11070 [Fictibacillus phosphorivorans]|uniref:hypothetical protein n=1 Tax=Fictibacillus phosphorivorans TaxID=1221500 RepID=UPI003CF7F593